MDIVLLEPPSPVYIPRIIPARCSGCTRFKLYWLNLMQKPRVLYASVTSHDLDSNILRYCPQLFFMDNLQERLEIFGHSRLNSTVCPQSPLGVLKNCGAQTN
jgi:hypothetical protein